MVNVKDMDSGNLFCMGFLKLERVLMNTACFMFL